MYTFTKRLRSAMVVAGVVAMMLIPVASPSVLAACHGNGVPYASNSGWGYEGPQNLTCDNLSDYNGRYRDQVSDGLLVRIRTRYINGSATWVYTGYTNGLNVFYYYSYWDGDKSTQFQIGRSDGVYATAGSCWGF